MPIQPNKPLIYNATRVGTENNPINGTMFHFYDINKKHIYSCWISATGKLPDSVINGKTPSNAYYLRISYGINDGWGTSYETLLTGQLEYGTILTDYIPHAENKKEIPLNEPLRSLPNGTKDRFVKIGGKWFIERNFVEIVVDGSYTWSINSNGSIYYATPRLDGNTYVLPTVNSKIGNIVCDNRIVTYIDYMYNNSVIGYIGLSKDGNLGLSLDNKTPEQIKEELTSNPMRVILQLKTPTYEPLEIEPTLNTYNDTTHLSNNSIIP